MRTVRGNGPSMNLRVEHKHVYWTLELRPPSRNSRILLPENAFLLGFLPILGLRMLPLGLLLLAEDVPPLKSARARILDWIERRHPNWLVPKV